MKRVKAGPSGPTIILHDKLRALELILAMAGNVKARGAAGALKPHRPGFDLEAYLVQAERRSSSP